MGRLFAMGFALWVDNQLAWAQGTHEYRPMGVAVIAATDLFAPRDFSPRRTVPGLARRASFAGLFASLEQVNAYLKTRRSQKKIRTGKPRNRRVLSII